MNSQIIIVQSRSETAFYDLIEMYPNAFMVGCVLVAVFLAGIFAKEWWSRRHHRRW